MLGKNKNKKLSTLQYVVRSICGTILFLLVIIGIIICIVPRPHLLAHRTNGKVKVDSEISFMFNLPVSRQVGIEITPKTYGEIVYDDTIVGKHLVRTFVFRPEVTWSPDTTYEVRVTNVKSAFPTFRKSQDFVYTFTTESAPVIAGVTPVTDGTIGPDAVWRVHLDKPNDRMANYEFRISPSIEVNTELNEDKTEYTITPTALLSQGTAYALQIYAAAPRYLFGTDTVASQDEPQSVWQGTWTVRDAPGILMFAPHGSTVALDAPTNITFSENIDLDSFKEHVTIEPSVSGTWATADNKTITFQHSAFAQETAYTVTFTAGLRTSAGGYLPENSVHTFTTVGPAKVSSSTPASGSQGVNVGSTIRLSFNQNVDHDSAAGKFSISPQVSGTTTWDGNTLLFDPNQALAYNTAYTVTLASGIKSDGGLDSVAAQTITFTTELSITRLSVSYHRQQHNLSCEVATLVMALAYRGINVSEATLINAIGFDPTTKHNGIWGDPYEAFVGDIDGHQPSTGYGVYWGPIAAAAQKYRTARIITGGKLSDITSEIKKGNPVIFWGTAGSGKRIDWKTPSGKNIMAVMGEHTRVAIGFIGSADNPSKIITLDPLFGEKYFSTASFLSNWAVLGSNAVVVE